MSSLHVTCKLTTAAGTTNVHEARLGRVTGLSLPASVHLEVEDLTVWAVDPAVLEDLAARLMSAAADLRTAIDTAAVTS